MPPRFCWVAILLILASSTIAQQQPTAPIANCRTEGYRGDIRICEVCNDRFFQSNNGHTCSPCHASCKNCKGPAENYCLDCHAGRFFSMVSKSSRVLQQQQPTGWCLPCHGFCATCSGMATQCLSCKDGSYFSATGLGYGTCSTCNSGCVTCNGPTGDDCLTCAAPFFKTSINNCKKCASGCASCDNASTCRTCFPRNYLTSSSLCHNCLPNCASCTNGVQCNQCDTTYKKVTTNGTDECKATAATIIMYVAIALVVILAIVGACICKLRSPSTQSHHHEDPNTSIGGGDVYNQAPAYSPPPPIRH